MMIKKKVCMLGAFATGKTSLVRQFVRSIFSEKYHTTVGVKIDKKSIVLKDQRIELILWDLHGEDDFQYVRMSYLKGVSGCIYVVDGTRRSSLGVALRLKSKAEKHIGDVPCIFAFNKVDLKKDWEIDPARIDDLCKNGTITIKTSAKTGQSVEDAFTALTALMMDRNNG